MDKPSGRSTRTLTTCRLAATYTGSPCQQRPGDTNATATQARRVGSDGTVPAMGGTMKKKKTGRGQHCLQAAVYHPLDGLLPNLPIRFIRSPACDQGNGRH